MLLGIIPEGWRRRPGDRPPGSIATKRYVLKFNAIEYHWITYILFAKWLMLIVNLTYEFAK